MQETSRTKRSVKGVNKNIDRFKKSQQEQGQSQKELSNKNMNTFNRS